MQQHCFPVKVHKRRNLPSVPSVWLWVNNDWIFIFRWSVCLSEAIYLCSACIPTTQTQSWCHSKSPQQNERTHFSKILNFSFCLWQQTVHFVSALVHSREEVTHNSIFFIVFMPHICFCFFYFTQLSFIPICCCSDPDVFTVFHLLSLQSCVPNRAEEVGLCMAGEYPRTELWIMATWLYSIVFTACESVYIFSNNY